MHVKLSKVLSDSVCLAIPAHFPDKFRRKLLQHYIVSIKLVNLIKEQLNVIVQWT